MKKEALVLADDLITFIDNSPTVFHSVTEIENRLVNGGFSPLNESDKWNIKNGGKYFVSRNNSSIVAFVLGRKKVWESGFRIVGAHTDSPSLKIKTNGASIKGGILRVSVEPYGGGINSTWLDRNLSIAGRIVIENKSGENESVFVDFKDPVAFVPNQAIHMNREVNKGFEYNKQNHLQALISCVPEDKDAKPADVFKNIIAEKSNIDAESIVDMELYLYDVQKGLICGMNKEFLSASRIDNLAMCHSNVEAMINADGQNDKTSVAVFFDNEEIGSRSIQGADSSFFRDILDRISIVTGGNPEDSYRSRALSFSISADGAHAHHPNFIDAHDPCYAPIINNGPVIKISANCKYTTTSETSGIFKKLCKDLDVPVQELINRSDVPSGSTIGPISSSLTGIKSIDVGSPMFAMHSIRETCGVLDHYYMTEVLKKFLKG